MKNPIIKGYVLYNSILTTLLKWQNYNNEKYNSDCQRLRTTSVCVYRGHGGKEGEGWWVLKGNTENPCCDGVAMVAVVNR